MKKHNVNIVHVNEDLEPRVSQLRAALDGCRQESRRDPRGFRTVTVG